MILGHVLLVAASAQAQSLGDVARREEARRKAVKAPSKVHTNDDLKHVDRPSRRPPRPRRRRHRPLPHRRSPDDLRRLRPRGATGGPRDEKYWRGQLEAARTALTRAQTFQEALQSRINALTTDFVNRHDPAQQNVIAADRQKALAEIDRVKQEIAQHQKAIADIQEEGRRAGAPAGWLR